MDSKIRMNETKPRQTASIPQIQVRSDVRSGGDLETCQFNLNKWRERYYYWYNIARQQGKI
jgi:hypothetical protein